MNSVVLQWFSIQAITIMLYILYKCVYKYIYIYIYTFVIYTSIFVYIYIHISLYLLKHYLFRHEIISNFNRTTNSNLC